MTGFYKLSSMLTAADAQAAQQALKDAVIGYCLLVYFYRMK